MKSVTHGAVPGCKSARDRLQCVHHVSDGRLRKILCTTRIDTGTDSRRSLYRSVRQVQPILFLLHIPISFSYVCRVLVNISIAVTFLRFAFFTLLIGVFVDIPTSEAEIAQNQTSKVNRMFFVGFLQALHRSS